MVALLVATFGCLVLYLTVLPFSLLMPRFKLLWRRFVTRLWARVLAGIIGLRIYSHNTPPNAPFLLVSNHLSYLDVIVLQSQLDCAFVAKSEVASWPLVGLAARSVGTIFIERKVGRHIQRTLKQIQETMGNGLGVVLFAEGTSTNGRTVSRFKSPLLEIAACEETPVRYASISYSVLPGERPAPESVCWWGDMTFPDHLFRMLKMPSLDAHLVYGVEPIVDSNRHVLAKKLWSAVSAQFEPVT
jgi:1-acyl-sn-glycerol-3-phosphate acyltransferase